jgi:hypothetical protein
MPDFLVIGFGKSGTTSIYHYLAQHPQIAMSAMKEPNYWAFGDAILSSRPSGVCTMTEYQALFADLPPGRRLGEASPSNISERACLRISQHLPSAQCICVLRQPVERMYSLFGMKVREGGEPEADFRRAYLDSLNNAAYRSKLHLRNYAADGAAWYRERLTDWMTRFPRRQLHIALYDDLVADPAAFMRGVYTFLGVDNGFVPNISKIHNQGTGVRSVRMSWLLMNNPVIKWAKRISKPCISPSMRRYVRTKLKSMNQAPLPPLDPQVRDELTRPQHDDIMRLQDLIGRDLSSWLAR